MKIDFKLLTFGILLVSFATFLHFNQKCDCTEATPAVQPDSIIILKDSISKLQNLNSTLEHEKLEINRKRDIDNNRNASLLALIQSINTELSRQHQDSIRVRQKRPPNSR